MNITIVGGSLGGLFAGLALKRLGHNVHILERNPTPLLHDQGAGIVAGAETRDYIEKFDKSKREITVKAAFRRYLDIQGNEIHREDWPQYMTSWDLVYHILRANFDGVKSEYCQVPDQAGGKTVYDYDAKVTDMKVENGEVTLFYEQENTKKSIMGDVLIAADGPSSSIRAILYPDVERKYAGYAAWRGTIHESEASESLSSTLVECFTFFHAPGTQILSYVIPGKNGTLERGKRFINWVWYCNYEDPSNVLTDCDGQTHRWTLPHGKVDLKVWENQKKYASDNLPPQFAELVNKTQSPFIQAITDVIAPQACHYNGRVILLGDALAGFRPHTAASTSQAAFHASQLWKNMKSWDEWMKNKSLYEETVMEFARHGIQHGQNLGSISQFGHHKLDGKMSMAPPSIRDCTLCYDIR
jgi:2-polyprenyl-6-methoxyphenol hydroxylase-like FAD-dependent oxidoreductase